MVRKEEKYEKDSCFLFLTLTINDNYRRLLRKDKLNIGDPAQSGSGFGKEYVNRKGECVNGNGLVPLTLARTRALSLTWDPRGCSHGHRYYDS